MKKTLNFTSLIPTLIAALLLISCTQLGSQSYQEVNYRTGTDGVHIALIENAPPLIADEESTFPVRAKIYNQGAYNIMSEKQENVYVTVIKDNYFIQGDTQGYTPPFGLRGKSDAYPDGQSYTLDLGLYKASTIPGNFEKPQTPLMITACYPYQTQLIQDVCIDTNSQNKRTQPCKSQESYTYSGQGAPVVITKVEPDMQQLKGGYIRPSFKIYVDNPGKGQVISPKPLPSGKTPEQVCTTQQAQKNEINNVQVNAYLSDLQLDCSSPGVPDYLDITSKESSIRCYVTDDQLQKEPARFGNRDNYQTTLRIELGYYYMTTDQKKITIRHVQTFDANHGPISPGPDLRSKCPFPWQTDNNGECVNKCDYCGSLPDGQPRPDFCTSKPILGKTYDLINGFKCACTGLSGPGNFDDLFMRETSYYDGNIKQFKPFKLAIQGDLCPDDRGCCKPVDCSNYHTDPHGCGLQPECTYCAQTSDDKKPFCYNAQNGAQDLSNEERGEQICKAHCKDRNYYNPLTRTCEKPPKETSKTEGTGTTFYIYTAKPDGTILGEPEITSRPREECLGTLITDPPGSPPLINREWCTTSENIFYADNEKLRAGTTRIPLPPPTPGTPPATTSPPSVPPSPPPASTTFSPLHVDTTHFYDDSPSGSYDFQLSNNGNLNVPVPAPFSGTIQRIALSTPGYGNSVEIRGNQNIWRFAHFKEVLVKQGQTVQQGTSLGIQGNTGNTQGATGIHVHVEIHRLANPIGNPSRMTDRSITEPLVQAYLDYVQGAAIA